MFTLPDDILDTILNLVGPGHHRYVAGTCRGFRRAYERVFPEQRETRLSCIVCSVSTAQLFLAEKHAPPSFGLFQATTTTTDTTTTKKCDDRSMLFRRRTQKAHHDAVTESLFRIAQGAARWGRLETLQWAVSQRKRTFTNQAYYLSHLRDAAAAGGQVACFRFLFPAPPISDNNDTIMDENNVKEEQKRLETEQNDKTKQEKDGAPSRYQWQLLGYLATAARHGQLAFMQHYFDNAQEGQDCFRIITDVYPLELYRAAVNNGHLPVVQFLHEVAKWPWQDNESRSKSYALCCGAAQYGRLNCLVYLHETLGLPLLPSMLEIPAKSGSVDCLRYLLETLERYFWNRRSSTGKKLLRKALRSTIIFGHVQCLSLLLEYLPKTMTTSNSNNNVSVALRQWWWDNADVEGALLLSARNAKLDCLVYLTKTRCIQGFAVVIGPETWEEALLETAAIGAYDCFVHILLQQQRGGGWSRSIRQETLLVAASRYAVHRDDVFDCLLDHPWDITEDDDDDCAWDSEFLHETLDLVVRRERVERLRRLLKVPGVTWDCAVLRRLAEHATQKGAMDCAESLRQFLANNA